jgi:uncharacterized protein (TIGR02594 family)
LNGILVTPYSIAVRYVGLAEIPGVKSHPFIQHCFSLCHMGLETNDDVAWCSAFLQHPFWELGLDRSGSARARSWLNAGISIPLSMAEPGFDVVVFKRGPAPQPGPEVIDAPGHVALYDSHTAPLVRVFGGNQGDKAGFARFPISDILEVRRCTSLAA